MYLLEVSQYEKVKTLIGEISHGIFPGCVCNGSNPGWIFADDPENPQSAFVFMKKLGGTLVGKSMNSKFNNALKENLDTVIIPKIRESGDDYFCVTGTTSDWNPSIEYVLKDKPAEKELVQRYQLHKLIKPKLNTDFQVMEITNETLKNNGIKNLNLCIDDIVTWWGSIECFLESGCGFIAVKDNQICGWTYSVCIVDSRVEIHIQTLKQFRSQGVGTALGYAFTKYCMDNGLTPEWEAMSDRDHSKKIAEKIGFRFDYDYKLYEFGL